jgi:hypothetical protein
MEASTRPEIPPGTLYMLILKTLARLGSMHGYGIAHHIQRTSDHVLAVEEVRSIRLFSAFSSKDGWKRNGSNRRITGGHDITA